MKLAAVTFTKQGEKLLNILREKYSIDHFSKSTCTDFKLKEIAKKLMKEYEGIIFFSATGIAVRAIAPYITTKDKDPAVLVIDNEGNFVISLLSGHLGGANELTIEIAEKLKAQPVITTATDGLGIEAPDVVAKKNNCAIDDMKAAKDIAALLVGGGKVAFMQEKDSNYIPKGYVPYEVNSEDMKALVYTTNKRDCHEILTISEDIKKLKLIKRNIVLGIGCRKDYSSEKMLSFVEKALSEYNIDSRAVCLIATVEVKAEERAIIELSEHYGCQLKICSLNEIKEVQHNFKGSDFVEKTIGVRAVAEPSVALCGAKILVERLSFEGMTLCIGEGE
jgi:cobalt-precorrin 5A hydrolase